MDYVDSTLQRTLRVSNLIQRKVIEYLLLLLTKAEINYLQNSQGHLKAKKMTQLISSLPNMSEIQGRARVPISSLWYVYVRSSGNMIMYLLTYSSIGSNEGKVVALKLLVDVVRGNEPPGYIK